MKRLFSILLLLPAAATLWAQSNVSIDDIINEKKKVSTTTNSTEHFAAVWHPRTYFDLIYTRNAELVPKKFEQFNDYTGVNTPLDRYKADWAFGIKNGRSIYLHRRPIGRVLYVGLDYTWIDLMLNHYQASCDNAGYCFDSSQMLSEGGKVFPVNGSKYEMNYGMALGPSITLAPFVYVEGANGLHHLKFNAYYHVGYNVGMLSCMGDEDQDYDSQGQTSLLFGHGLTMSYGASINWKCLGLGIEVRKAALKHKSGSVPLFNSDDDTGEGVYDFNSTGQRLFLQFRF